MKKIQVAPSHVIGPELAPNSEGVGARNSTTTDGLGPPAMERWLGEEVGRGGRERRSGEEVGRGLFQCQKRVGREVMDGVLPASGRHCGW